MILPTRKLQLDGSGAGAVTTPGCQFILEPDRTGYPVAALPVTVRFDGINGSEVVFRTPGPHRIAEGFRELRVLGNVPNGRFDCTVMTSLDDGTSRLPELPGEVTLLDFPASAWKPSDAGVGDHWIAANHMTATNPTTVAPFAVGAFHHLLLCTGEGGVTEGQPGGAEIYFILESLAGPRADATVVEALGVGTASAASGQTQVLLAGPGLEGYADEGVTRLSTRVAWARVRYFVTMAGVSALHFPVKLVGIR